VKLHKKIRPDRGCRRPTITTLAGFNKAKQPRAHANHPAKAVALPWSDPTGRGKKPKTAKEITSAGSTTFVRQVQAGFVRRAVDSETGKGCSPAHAGYWFLYRRRRQQGYVICWINTKVVLNGKILWWLQYVQWLLAMCGMGEWSVVTVSDLQYRTVTILKTLFIGTVATIINKKIHSLASIISYVLIYTQLASYVNLPHSHFGAMGKSSRHITLSSTTTNTHSISLHGSTKRLSLKHNKLLEKGVPLKIR
jgi:hypothetical protein